MALKRKELGGSEHDLHAKKFRRGLQDDGGDDQDDDPFRDETAPAEPIKLSRADTDRKYVCLYPNCGHICDRPAKMEAHQRIHTGERPFRCAHEDCDRTFTRKDHLNRHIKLAHSEVERPRPFPCTWPDCTKRFDTKQHLTVHIATHENKFYCTGYPPCNEAFRKQKTLDDHIATTHLQTKPYPCPHSNEETGEQCHASYKTASHLREHVERHHPGEGRQVRYSCAVCPAPGTDLEDVETEFGVMQIPKEPLSFATYKECMAHNRDHHKPVCATCGRKFKTIANMRAHCEVVHGDPETQPQYPCPESGCDLVFNRDYNLKTHVRTVHQNTRPFVCAASSFADSKKPDLKAWAGHDACGTSFGAKSTLEQHVRTQHLYHENRKAARKAAKANKKSKAMPQPSTLRLLTGVGFDGGRNIACMEKGCGDKFFYNRDLRRHLRAVHNIEDERIEEIILEGNALRGDQFWLTDEDKAMLESADPSMPQTPDPFQGSYVSPYDTYLKPGDAAPPQEMPFDDFNLVLADKEELEMDVDMGLQQLHAWNVHNGLPPV